MSKINYEDLKYKLERCKNISLDEIDRDTIPELSELKVAKKKSSNERVIDFINNVSNPYIFKVNGNLVQIAFSDNNKSAENCITKVIKSIYK